MSLLLPVTIGVLVGCGVFLMLQRNVLKLVLGLSLLSHAANVALITAGWRGFGRAPIADRLEADAVYADPLPQALILTAIVIGFASTAFLLVLALRAHRDLNTDDIARMRRLRG